VSTVHEIYAVKFAQNDTSKRGDFFMGPDAEPHEEPMQLDYFVWAIRSPGQDVVLDTGFTSSVNEHRGRTYLEEPSQALRRLGVAPTEVEHVILSHLHYDHAGGVDHFPAATIHLQADELAFWTGPYARRAEFLRTIEVEDIVRIVRLNLTGRLDLAQGSRQIVDGVWVHHYPGHTPGSQFVTVRTARGVVVLAADTSHFYENVEQDKPFGVHTDVVGLYRTFDAMRELATSGLVVAGHDPLLFERFPSVDGLEGRALRIA